MSINVGQRRIPFRSFTVSWDDVKKIYNRLLAQVQRQAEREVASLLKPVDQTDIQFEGYKSEIKKNAFRVTVTMRGANGDEFFGDEQALFDSPSLPENIVYIFMTNRTAYQTFTNMQPINNFDFCLDFSKPPLLDNNNPLSNPTPNASSLNVAGDKDTWIPTIRDAVLEIIVDKYNNRNFIHRSFVYDIGLIIFGIPLGFYFCWKFSDVITDLLNSFNPFVSAFVFVYIMICSIWGYRAFFGYTKWAFPKGELVESKDSAGRHRKFWYVIGVGLIVNFLIEFLL